MSGALQSVPTAALLAGAPTSLRHARAATAGRTLVAIVAMLALLGGCEQGRPPGEPEASQGAPEADIAAAPPRTRTFQVDWSPKDGRGAVTQVMPNGDRYSLCFSCLFKGYTGGLWLGSMNGSGFLWTPKTPHRGFPELNLFCAQDESIYEASTGLEVVPGWSENFGTGPDGVPLTYVEGEVIRDGSVDDVVLRSLNRSEDGLSVAKLLRWKRGESHIVVDTRLQNDGALPRTVSFWTGDDPWIGLYRTSDGDVGWTSQGIVRTEQAVDASTFAYGGMLDLGNSLVGDAQGFSNTANFLALDPQLERADRVTFANRFAHDTTELDPTRPLDNTTMTAFNVGWVERTLQPGESLHVRYALGHAIAGEPGQVPSLPPIDWAWWEGAAAFRAPGPRFVEEKIDLSVLMAPLRLAVHAEYGLLNVDSQARAVHLFYPFPLDPTHEFPENIKVTGAVSKGVDKGVVLDLDLEPGAIQWFVVDYEQRLNSPFARYILRSTETWGAPLRVGRYSVRWPKELVDAEVSYPGERTLEGETWVQRFERHEFMPPADLELRWAAP